MKKLFLLIAVITALFTAPAAKAAKRLERTHRPKGPCHSPI